MKILSLATLLHSAQALKIPNGCVIAVIVGIVDSVSLNEGIWLNREVWGMSSLDQQLSISLVPTQMRPKSP